MVARCSDKEDDPVVTSVSELLANRVSIEMFWVEDGKDPQSMGIFPSGGDTSYAGWLDIKPGRALVSYYSSHEHKMDEPHENDALFKQNEAYAEHTTASDIFLADVSYE